MAYYLIIRGPLGVGKSTVAAALAQRMGAQVISVDATLLELGLDNGHDDISEQAFLKAMDHISLQVAEQLQHNRSVIIDGNFYYLAQIVSLEQKLGPPQVVITLDATVEVCGARDAARPLSHGLGAVAAIYNLVHRIKVGTYIDTTHQSIETVVDEIDELLNRE